MSSFRSDFLRTLDERGFIHQCSDAAGLDERAAAGPLSAYIGFDCTAPSLHVGSLVQIMMLYWLQKTGHRPVVLMGSGTTRVGDPSGKDESRQMLSEDTIEQNKAAIAEVFSRLLAFGDGPTDAVMVDNADWLLALNYIEFLRDYGRHFSVNQMIQRESVKLRLEREHHLSFLEFNYMVLQAYDFVELFRRERCILQMGGSDQWGNIVSGIDLGRRVEDVQLYALTTPLIATSTGAKMGKTAAGAVWLDASRCSPYEYWQYWRNTDDADVGRFLRLFTALPLDEIERLEALSGSEINEAKKRLATEATSLLHGRDEAERAGESARRTFEEGAAGAALPTVEIEESVLEAGVGLLSALVQAGLAASNGEARRNVRGGGVRVNDEVVGDERRTLSLADLTREGHVKLSLGRKRHALLKVGSR